MTDTVYNRYNIIYNDITTTESSINNETTTTTDTNDNYITVGIVLYMVMD